MRLYAGWLYKRILIWPTILAVVTVALLLLLQIDANRWRSADLRRGEFRTKFVTKMRVQDRQQQQEQQLSSIISQVTEIEMHDTAEIGIKDLIARSKLLTANSDPDPLTRCPMYEEFRWLDFTQSVLRRRLCSSVVEAYRILPGEDVYPICRLQQPFNADLIDIVKRDSEIVSLFDASGYSVQIFAYKWPDYVSSLVKSTSAWQPNVTLATLRLAISVPDVTFLDLGCGIGIDSVRAARLGLPVVALDANIRHLLRLRLSLEAASLDADLVWNFIASDLELRYLNFPNDLCKIGSNDAPVPATTVTKGNLVTKRNLVDTIPVMPLRGERLSQLIRTKHLVIKMGIEAGDADFLSVSESLFTDFTVAAVQMEWQTSRVQDAELAYVLNFFASRDYKVWKLPDFRPLNPNNTRDWGTSADIIWIHGHFLHLAKV